MIKILITLFLLITPMTLYAEPSSTVNYLIGQPASMFDLGMNKLENFLLRLEFPRISGMDIEVRLHLPIYDRAGNRIRIGATAESEGGHSLQQVCKIVTNELKTRLGSNKKGEINPKKLSVGDFFGHSGYENKSDPKNLVNEINQIVLIEVNANHTSRGKGRSYTSTKSVSSLLSDKILFVD